MFQESRSCDGAASAVTVIHQAVENSQEQGYMHNLHGTKIFLKAGEFVFLFELHFHNLEFPSDKFSILVSKCALTLSALHID